MRKFLAAALAVPVLLLVYAGALVRRPGSRLPIAIVALVIAGALGASALRPTPATGTAPTHGSAIPAFEFTTAIETGESPHAPIVVTFPSPMNGASVESLVTIDPATPTRFSWDSSMTRLIVTPQDAWAVGTLHTITVEAGALDAGGRPLDHRVRAVFLTRGPTTATIEVGASSAAVAPADASIRIAFSGPVNATTIALNVSPALAGHVVPAVGTDPSAPVFAFIPDGALAPGTTYTVTLADAARDADGLVIVSKAVTIRTAGAPVVVRFRPVDGTKSVAWGQDLSVRFSEPMDHVSTQAAWTATQGGKPIAGTFTWAQHDTVLVFNPKSNLGYAQKVVASVGAGATSRAGLSLKAAASATFTTAAKPVTTRPRSGGGTRVTSGGGSTSIGGSTWAAVEAYYLKLMNCTRTGGWVTSTGACSSPGGRNVAPLWQDAGITAKVSRPYAKKLVLANVCSHFYTTTPAQRLRAAGYTSYVWAENLGCEGGNPYSAVLGDHRFFQAEASTNGGHYVNLMNAKYDRVGIGVWVYSGRVRLVIDFYHPL